jgi:hypothetical protein
MKVSTIAPITFSALEEETGQAHAQLALSSIKHTNLRAHWSFLSSCPEMISNHVFSHEPRIIEGIVRNRGYFVIHNSLFGHK